MLDGRDPDAAAVADRLKAFLADPPRLARLYLQGAEPLPDGGTVLRFAQGRFAATANVPEAERLRRAADEFVRRVCLADRADHYQALCARPDASHETIKENYHLLMALLHPDRQEHASDPWPEAFAQRVNLAYATVGDAPLRRQYDARLRAERRGPPRGADRALRPVRRSLIDVRFAKALIAVSAVVAALLAVALAIDADEWGDRSVLQAALARVGARPIPGSERPRYVGATAMTQQRASDAVVAEEPRRFAFLEPLMHVLVPQDPTPVAPVPRLEAIPARPPVIAAPPARATPTLQPMAVAQASSAPPVADPAPRAPDIAPKAGGEATGPTNQEIESLVVALIGYYEAGDADRLVGLVDSGYWRAAQMRQAYADFFRATRARRLRLERLSWDTQSGAAHAKGEATVTAEYFDSNAPLERHVDVELDIGMRDGRPRITRLALFPGR